jgi:hypothetical protein
VAVTARDLHPLPYSPVEIINGHLKALAKIQKSEGAHYHAA